jgi:hypothetical protein
MAEKTYMSVEEQLARGYVAALDSAIADLTTALQTSKLIDSRFHAPKVEINISYAITTIRSTREIIRASYEKDGTTMNVLTGEVESN